MFGELYRNEDTIAALATPPGNGGIQIIRISGREAVGVLGRIFRGRKEPGGFRSHRMYFGYVVDPDTGRDLDRVLAVYMKGPHSYTGEDVTEIHCHGSHVLAGEILRILADCGVRCARPGEFTCRAYLNGRMDLTQAEAVDALVKSKSRTGLQVAMNHLEGRLSETMKKVRDEIVDILVHIEVSLDFVEEDLEIYSGCEMERRVGKIEERVKGLVDSLSSGRIAREGISVPIVGRSNVGKSSLLNMLLQEERAIVTVFPGTTRDVIEDWVDIEGFSVRLVDTAGIRQGGDPVEMEGMRRTVMEIERADLVLLVVDGSEPLDREDRNVRNRTGGRPLIVVINKTDLPRKVSEEEIRNALETDTVVRVSAKYHRGAPDLHDSLKRFLGKAACTEREPLCVWNARQYGLLRETLVNLERVREGLKGARSEEYISFDLREVLSFIDDLTGETTNDDVLERIFQSFCIGK